LISTYKNGIGGGKLAWVEGEYLFAAVGAEYRWWFR
jgi:hypothetical protein